MTAESRTPDGATGTAPGATRTVDGATGTARGATPTADGATRTVDGATLIFRLFVVLALATAASLFVFVQFMGDCDVDGVDDRLDTSIACDGMPAYDGTHVATVVYRALAGDLAAPVVAWFIIKAIHKRRSTAQS